MLELVGVVVTDGGVSRLDRCSFEVRSGEVFGIIGKSGSGKTSVLEIASGMRSPDRGRVLLDGRDATRRPGRLRTKTALLTHVLPGPYDLTADAWLKLWADLDGVPAGDRKKRHHELIERFGLRGLGGRRVATLSFGQRAGLAAIRLFAQSASLYLLDAPAFDLDGAGLRALAASVRSAAAAGATVVLTAAAPHFPATVCDRVIGLDLGKTSVELCRGDADYHARIAETLGWLT